MDTVIYLVGRFHPLMVHLPVALLPLAGIFWVLSKYNRFKSLEHAVTPLLIVGLLAAIVSVLSGLALASGGDYDEGLLNNHRALGIASTGIALLVLFLHGRKFNPKILWPLFIILIVLISLTGHWGGMLTHGENWFALKPAPKNIDVLIKLKTISIDSNSQAQLYSDLVAPLLEAKCVSCHNGQKQKGELRLDNPEYISKGGKHGLIVDFRKPEKSELLLRITKTIDEKGHMPPRQEAQLENLEVELLKWWIHAGAPFDKTLAQAKPPALLSKLWQAKPVPSLRDWLPEKPIEPADQSILDSLQKNGLKITPLAQESNYLMITTAGESTIPDRGWQQLEKLSQHVVDLDVSFSILNTTAIKSISKLSQLRRIKLSNTNLNDGNLKQLASCAELRSLHMVNTSITKACEPTLQQWKNLKEVFAFGTGLDSAANLGTVVLNTGNYTLPNLPTDTIIHRKK